jgi:hypothetical protein
VSDASSSGEASGGGAASKLLPLTVGAAVAAGYVAGRTLIERRRRGADGAGAARDASADAVERPADLATELRGAAGDLAVTLLDRVTERLERAKV